MMGTLDKINNHVTLSRVVAGDSVHNRLFVWGNWGAEDNVEAHLTVAIGFDSGGPFFPYHEGETIPILDEKGNETGDEELATLVVDADGYHVLKDIGGLHVRLTLEDADDYTRISYRLV